jgi:hypothetical protein
MSTTAAENSGDRTYNPTSESVWNRRQASRLWIVRTSSRGRLRIRADNAADAVRLYMQAHSPQGGSIERDDRDNPVLQWTQDDSVRREYMQVVNPDGQQVFPVFEESGDGTDEGNQP